MSGPAHADPQRPLPAQEQAKLEALAKETADASAARMRTWLGALHPQGHVAFRHWALVVWDWKRERGVGADPFLAEGVLLDCLDRSLGLYVEFTWGRAVDRRLWTLALPRADRALELFQRALDADPALVEARFRTARLRAIKGEKDASQLEQLASSTINDEVAYLAAITRAGIAQDRKDPGAVHWFERARTLRPRSTAAAVGLSALRPETPIDFSALDPVDPFYDYPCRFLTPSVGAELSRRIAKLSAGR